VFAPRHIGGVEAQFGPSGIEHAFIPVLLRFGIKPAGVDSEF